MTDTEKYAQVYMAICHECGGERECEYACAYCSVPEHIDLLCKNGVEEEILPYINQLGEFSVKFDNTKCNGQEIYWKDFVNNE